MRVRAPNHIGAHQTAMWLGQNDQHALGEARLAASTPPTESASENPAGLWYAASRSGKRQRSHCGGRPRSPPRHQDHPNGHGVKSMPDAEAPTDLRPCGAMVRRPSRPNPTFYPPTEGAAATGRRACAVSMHRRLAPPPAPAALAMATLVSAVAAPMRSGSTDGARSAGLPHPHTTPPGPADLAL